MRLVLKRGGVINSHQTTHRDQDCHIEALHGHSRKRRVIQPGQGHALALGPLLRPGIMLVKMDCEAR